VEGAGEAAVGVNNGQAARKVGFREKGYVRQREIKAAVAGGVMSAKAALA